VLSEFREFVKAKATPKPFIDKQLVPYAQAFLDINKQSYESTAHAEAINHSLKLLERMDERDWIGPALLYHTKNKDKSESLKQFYADLERLTAGLWIMRFDVNQRLERYGALIQEIQDGKDIFLPESSLQLKKEEMDKVIKALDGDIYNISRKNRRTMILLRLDELLSSGEASYQFKIITIEHVLPQNPEPDSQWLKWWTDDKKRQVDVHRLGNLALLNKKQNSSANNYEFEKKKRSYFASKTGTSPFSLTTQILQQNEWTPKVFEDRQTALLDHLKKAWRLEQA
jgi:hypothetical protein